MANASINIPNSPFLVGRPEMIAPEWLDWLTHPSVWSITTIDKLSDDVLAVRSFTPSNPLTQPALAENGAAQLAARIFMPHVGLTQPVVVPPADDSAVQLAARSFMPHVPLTQAPVIPTVPTTDDGSAMIASRAFAPRFPIQPLPQDASIILAASIFGA